MMPGGWGRAEEHFIWSKPGKGCASLEGDHDVIPHTSTRQLAAL
jgi:hypothetical protein